jgi:hypothetical protein
MIKRLLICPTYNPNATPQFSVGFIPTVEEEEEEEEVRDDSEDTMYFQHYVVLSEPSGMEDRSLTVKAFLLLTFTDLIFLPFLLACTYLLTLSILEQQQTHSNSITCILFVAYFSIQSNGATMRGFFGV